MQPSMKFFLVHLILISVSLLTTTFASDINCPPSISMCSAVPQMSPNLYLEWAKKCLIGPVVTASYDFDNRIDSDPQCMRCFCAHFLARFPHEQQRAWVLQKSWARGTLVSLSQIVYLLPYICTTNSALPSQNQRATIVPSAPLAKWVRDPHTEVSTKGMPQVGWERTGLMTATLITCISLGAGLLLMQFKDFLLDHFGQQPTPIAPPDGRLKCRTTGKFIKKGFPCECGQNCGGDSKKVWWGLK